MKNDFKDLKIHPVYLFDNLWGSEERFTKVMSDVHIELLTTHNRPYRLVGSYSYYQLEGLNRFWLWNSVYTIHPFYKTKKKTWR